MNETEIKIRKIERTITVKLSERTLLGNASITILVGLLVYVIFPLTNQPENLSTNSISGTFIGWIIITVMLYQIFIAEWRRISKQIDTELEKFNELEKESRK